MKQLTLLLLLLSVVHGSVIAQKNTPVKLDKKVIRLVNRTAEPSSDNGVVLTLNQQTGDGMAILNDVRMEEGILNIELHGENKPGQSFVGIAFNIQNDSTYEAVYFRPFNFRSEDKVRRGHGIQYVCHPEFTWNKLRAERTGEFEAEFPAPPGPDDWFAVSLTIEPDRVIVKDSASGNVLLSVNRLVKSTSPKIGLWVGNNSKGSFRKLHANQQ